MTAVNEANYSARGRPWYRCTDVRCPVMERYPEHEHPGGLAHALVEDEVED